MQNSMKSRKSIEKSLRKAMKKGTWPRDRPGLWSMDGARAPGRAGPAPRPRAGHARGRPSARGAGSPRRQTPPAAHLQPRTRFHGLSGQALPGTNCRRATEPTQHTNAPANIHIGSGGQVHKRGNTHSVSRGSELSST